MKFCPKCDNMFYLQINREQDDESNELAYVCRFCKYNTPADSSEMIQVLNTQVNNREMNFHHIINKYTKYDPTLPVMEKAVCPREDCKGTRILYMRYDEDNLKYLYICSTCDYYWK